MLTKPEYEIDPKTAAMIVVDPQRAFGDVVPVPEVEVAIINMKRAATFWREAGGNRIVTRHGYLALREVGRVYDFIPGVYDVLKEGSMYTDFHSTLDRFAWDQFFRKTEFNAFVNTKLESYLRGGKNDGQRPDWVPRETLIICGLTTPICVEATVRGAVERGFKVIVLSDACASQPMGDESAVRAHDNAIGRMGYVFAQIMTTDEFIARLS
jgi:biuret amidohydrolase